MSLDEAAVASTAPPELSAHTSEAVSSRIDGIVTGLLIGFKDSGVTPLVLFAGQQGTAGVPARAVVDLHGAHIGRPVILMFDEGNPMKPIVMGCLRNEVTGLARQPGHVEVEADGERFIVSARQQLVLRCGEASITLTRAGHVLIRGTYVSSRSSGVNRIKGGSVQLN